MFPRDPGLATKSLATLELRARVHVGRSHELYSPSTLQEMGRTISDERALLTGMRPQVFSTSRRLSPPTTLSDLFRSDNVLGGFTLQRFSLTCCRTPLG
jgi:hypothetical protein